jgi:large repetitive protein
VNCINDVPVANNASYTSTGNIITSSGFVLVRTMSGTDIDTGTLLTYSINTMPTNGVLTSTGKANFTYTPALGFSGSDSFTYTVSDGSATSNIATISITVISNTINQPPVASSGSSTTSEDIQLIAPLVASDPE